MNPPRKSIFGGRGLVPVRIDMSAYRSQRKKSPPGASRLTPSPNSLQGRRTTPRRAMTPIRPCDLSARDASILFSIKRSPNTKPAKSTGTTRRCLYQDKVQNDQACSSNQSLAAPAVKCLPKPKITSVKSRIPKPPSVKKTKPPSAKKTKPPTVKKTAPASRINPVIRSVVSSGGSKEQADFLNELRSVHQQHKEEQHNMIQEHQKIIQEQQKIIQEQQKIIQEQKSMISEAKEAFSEILSAQKLFLEEGRKALDKTTASDDFTSVEKAIISEFNTLKDGKENLNNSRKSEVAYRQMRRSFRCLGTPTLTNSNKKPKTPQVRTPRTSLSNRVRAQLQNLLDD